jgi:hypothetical protein
MGVPMVAAAGVMAAIEFPVTVPDPEPTLA